MLHVTTTRINVPLIFSQNPESVNLSGLSTYPARDYRARKFPPLLRNRTTIQALCFLPQQAVGIWYKGPERNAGKCMPKYVSFSSIDGGALNIIVLISWVQRVISSMIRC